MRCTIPSCQSQGDDIDYKLGPFMPQTMLLMNEYIFVQVTVRERSESVSEWLHACGGFVCVCMVRVCVLGRGDVVCLYGGVYVCVCVYT